MPLARFIALHDVAETAHAHVGTARFAVMLAGTPRGTVLVFSRYRRVWELPGGLIDPGESARECARREFAEETGGTAGSAEWLGLLEVHDGATHFGGVYRCIASSVPDRFQNEETGGLAWWTRDGAPEPLGHADAVLLNRFG